MSSIAFLLLISCNRDAPRTALDYARGTTDADGLAELDLAELGVTLKVAVASEADGTPVADAEVTAMADDADVLVVTRGAEGHVLGLAEVAVADLGTSAAKDLDAEFASGLLSFVLPVWDYVTSFYQASVQTPTVLFEEDNYTVFCMTRNELENELDVVESGLFLLGDVVTLGASSKVKKTVVVAKLTSDATGGILMEVVDAEYGEHEDYTVLVPNSPLVFEASDGDLVYDVGLLGQAIDEAPAWAVLHGSCEALAEAEDDEDTPADTVCDGALFCDDFSSGPSSDWTETGDNVFSETDDGIAFGSLDLKSPTLDVPDVYRVEYRWRHPEQLGGLVSVWLRGDDWKLISNRHTGDDVTLDVNTGGSDCDEGYGEADYLDYDAPVDRSWHTTTMVVDETVPSYSLWMDGDLVGTQTGWDCVFRAADLTLDIRGADDAQGAELDYFGVWPE